MSDHITCYEEWHELSSQRQWELYQEQRAEIERLRAENQRLDANWRLEQKYRLETANIVMLYQIAVHNRDMERLRDIIIEVGSSGIEYDAGKYVTVQLDPYTWQTCHKAAEEAKDV